MKKWLVLLSALVCAGCVVLRAPELTRVEAPHVPTRVLLIADNQEHGLTGGPLKSMGNLAEIRITPVAQRSPLANVGGRFLFRRALAAAREGGATLVLHLGDAADISCPDEFARALDALDGSGLPWFMAPGNHDGFLAGNFANYQPSTKQDLAADAAKYFASTNPGSAAGEPQWVRACWSPTASDSASLNILTKGDAIARYTERLRARPGVNVAERTESVRIEGVSVTCDVLELSSGDFNYVALARICRRTPVPGRDTFVGPWASYITQKLEVDGYTVLLLDTSAYENPALRNVALSGALSEAQRKTAERFLEATPPEKRLVMGHHPFNELTRGDRKWLAERTTRYVSAHSHIATNIRDVGGDVRELNIGSVLDWPPQYATLVPADEKLVVHTSGAETTALGFLATCVDRRSAWALDPEKYRAYRGSKTTYPVEITRAIRAAASRLPGPPVLVVGSGVESDWKSYAALLGVIDESPAAQAEFWACQAFYASEATQDETAIGSGIVTSKTGTAVKDGWVEF